MPRLLPGILELSQVARFFSVHAFLLDEYRRRRLPPNLAALSRFIKACEWDLGLAVVRCPCDISPVGARRLSAVDPAAALLPRGESVDSSLGGYGLYYRTPMGTLGLVARAGSLLGEDPTPVDAIRLDSPRATRLVAEFRAAVEGTTYVQRYLNTPDPIPVEVIEEFAAQACLCRLPERPAERAAVYEALFGADPTDDGESGADPDRVQRRRTAAHFLTLVDAEPEVAVDESAYRRAAGRATGRLGPAHERVAGQWAGVMAKDVWQDAVCSLWSSFCRAGLAAGRRASGGLTQTELDRLVLDLLDASPRLDGDLPARTLVEQIKAGAVTLPVPGRDPLPVAEADLEDLRIAAESLDTATSGLLVILELARRVAARTDTGWRAVLSTDAFWQRSVGRGARGAHLPRPGRGDRRVNSSLAPGAIRRTPARADPLLEAARLHLPVPLGRRSPAVHRQRRRALPAGRDPTRSTTPNHSRPRAMDWSGLPSAGRRGPGVRGRGPDVTVPETAEEPIRPVKELFYAAPIKIATRHRRTRLSQDSWNLRWRSPT